MLFCSVQDIIEDGNHLTFDYMALMLCSSVIAGGGLIGDSNASVIASMLGEFIILSARALLSTLLVLLFSFPYF